MGGVACTAAGLLHIVCVCVCVIIDLCMAISWSRVADMTQRSVSLALSGLTLLGLAVLAHGGYGVLQRKNQRAALEQKKNVSNTTLNFSIPKGTSLTFALGEQVRTNIGCQDKQIHIKLHNPLILLACRYQ